MHAILFALVHIVSPPAQTGLEPPPPRTQRSTVPTAVCICMRYTNDLLTDAHTHTVVTHHTIHAGVRV